MYLDAFDGSKKTSLTIYYQSNKDDLFILRIMSLPLYDKKDKLDIITSSGLNYKKLDRIK